MFPSQPTSTSASLYSTKENQTSSSSSSSVVHLAQRTSNATGVTLNSSTQESSRRVLSGKRKRHDLPTFSGTNVEHVPTKRSGRTKRARIAGGDPSPSQSSSQSRPNIPSATVEVIASHADDGGASQPQPSGPAEFLPTYEDPSRGLPPSSLEVARSAAAAAAPTSTVSSAERTHKISTVVLPHSRLPVAPAQSSSPQTQPSGPTYPPGLGFPEAPRSMPALAAPAPNPLLSHILYTANQLSQQPNWRTVGTFLTTLVTQTATDSDFVREYPDVFSYYRTAFLTPPPLDFGISGIPPLMSLFGGSIATPFFPPLSLFVLPQGLTSGRTLTAPFLAAYSAAPPQEPRASQHATLPVSLNSNNDSSAAVVLPSRPVHSQDPAVPLTPSNSNSSSSGDQSFGTTLIAPHSGPSPSALLSRSVLSQGPVLSLTPSNSSAHSNTALSSEGVLRRSLSRAPSSALPSRQMPLQDPTRPFTPLNSSSYLRAVLPSGIS